MLAEATTTEITREEKPQTFEENKKIARAGGEIAGNTRKEIEARTNKPVITSKKAVDFMKVLDIKKKK